MVGDQNYVISTREGRQKTRLCHINLLKNTRVAHESQQLSVSRRMSVEMLTLLGCFLDDQLGHLTSEWKSYFKALSSHPFSKMSLNCP